MLIQKPTVRRPTQPFTAAPTSDRFGNGAARLNGRNGRSAVGAQQRRMSGSWIASQVTYGGPGSEAAVGG